MSPKESSSGSLAIRIDLDEVAVDRMATGVFVGAARTRLGLSQQELAARCGRSQGWLSAIEKGKAPTDDPQRLLLAQALGLSGEDRTGGFDATLRLVLSKSEQVTRLGVLLEGASVAPVLPPKGVSRRRVGHDDETVLLARLRRGELLWWQVLCLYGGRAAVCAALELASAMVVGP